ncbi:30S ribosomal protein S3ae [Candidatus Methanomassiliicoccus intestinalis]|jgi:30S ribosomal protein S3Ae|uniref:Small ribosomal subunit protein eS1 n=2 Tax=Candidatus Methanomassiliicoccus intestinalis TaxID=1406512 RepID=R9T8N9_METII|nr:30S ribosomal protein S3ae [Candidatus Methanomassiliicoccus intestinalis]AGN25713.1 30S ribosomal protein S3Ae [Candidatus Methanomassiliicoccus intestinalis Issoire-Mx1]TQS82780.1 MAG: SSU ribosomal protein S3AE [Candidatus Methanomassiliicoccus intestinalis]TQS84061.1 MAG: SSU ribosomal protein S3AE [Candidatus Methanomassiliicoccus intestinalis]
MAVKKGKAAARKVKDKWKAKEWYKLYAPRMFNQVELGETPSADPASLIGRNIEVTVHELTGDFSKMHIKMRFSVEDVNGFEAHTAFIGHELTSDYVRRLTRRKRTKTDHVVDVRTKDNFVVRIKPMSITEQRIQAAQETAVRNILTETLTTMAADMSISDLVKSIISGDLSRDLSNAVKVIIPIKRIEIRKSEVIKAGTPDENELSIQERIGQETAVAEPEEPESEDEASEEAPAEEAVSEESESEEIVEESAEETPAEEN